MLQRTYQDESKKQEGIETTQRYQLLDINRNREAPGRNLAMFWTTYKRKDSQKKTSVQK